MVVQKNWGKEILLLEEDSHNVKGLWLQKGKQHHLKYHNAKTETLFVVRGTGFMIRNGLFHEIEEGQCYTILPRIIHKVWASIKEDLVLLEVNCPSLEESVCLEID